MAEKEICNTRLLNWTYTNLEAFFGAFTEAKIWTSLSNLNRSFSPALFFPFAFLLLLLRHLIVFPLSLFCKEVWLANFSGKGHLIKNRFRIDQANRKIGSRFFYPKCCFFCVCKSLKIHEDRWKFAKSGTSGKIHPCWFWSVYNLVRINGKLTGFMKDIHG